MIGVEIENFKILALLGEGGMGSVYKALDTKLDRMVALKLLNPGLSEDPELEARFRAEARTQATFNHQNIAILFSLLTWQGRMVMVMEFVEGKTLLEMVTAYGPMHPSTVMALSRQALSGVGAAHQKGVIHRDLKPANLMLNGDGILKVMDFGIAKIQTDVRLTRTATKIGTCLYMAPEQIRGEDVDARTDIYSMGATLYELLTGAAPFCSSVPYKVEQGHLHEIPVSPSVRNSAVPQGLSKVVLRALEKNPEDRFQNTSDFMKAIRLAEAEPVIVVQEPGPQEKKGTDGPGGTQVIRSGGGGPGVIVDPGPAGEPKPTLEPKKDKSRGVLLGVGGGAVLAAVLGVGWFYAAKPNEPNTEPAQQVVTQKPPVDHQPPQLVIPKPVHPNNNPAVNPDPVPVKAKETLNVPPVTPKPDVLVTPNHDPTPTVTKQPTFAGHWKALFQDASHQQDDSQAEFTLQEEESKQLAGTMTFHLVKDPAEEGSCTVSELPNENPADGVLTLLLHGCTNAKAPKYFHSPAIFGNMDLKKRSFTGSTKTNTGKITDTLLREGS